MQPDNRPDRPACALSLSPLNIPNPYLGWMILTAWGAQSIIDSFSGAVPCDVVMPAGALVAGAPARIDEAVLTRVRFELVPHDCAEQE